MERAYLFWGLLTNGMAMGNMALVGCYERIAGAGASDFHGICVSSRVKRPKYTTTDTRPNILYAAAVQYIEGKAMLARMMLAGLGRKGEGKQKKASPGA